MHHYNVMVQKLGNVKLGVDQEVDFAKGAKLAFVGSVTNVATLSSLLGGTNYIHEPSLKDGLSLP